MFFCRELKHYEDFKFTVYWTADNNHNKTFKINWRKVEEDAIVEHSEKKKMLFVILLNNSPHLQHINGLCVEECKNSTYYKKKYQYAAASFEIPNNSRPWMKYSCLRRKWNALYLLQPHHYRPKNISD